MIGVSQSLSALVEGGTSLPLLRLIDVIWVLSLIHIETGFLSKIGLERNIKVVELADVIKLETSFTEEFVRLIKYCKVLRQCDSGVVCGHTIIKN